MSRLLAATYNVLNALAAAPEWDQGAIRFEGMTRDLRQLGRSISETSGVCSEANERNIRVPIGTPMGTVRNRVARHQAREVDAVLRVRAKPASSDVAPWVIDYRDHGGFIAWSTQPPDDLTSPTTFSGFASTPAAAIDVVQQWFTGCKIPQVRHQNAMLTAVPHLAQPSNESEMVSREARGDIEQALEHQGRCYDELRNACQKVRAQMQADAHTPTDVLARQANDLNETHPQPPEDMDLASIGYHATELHKAWIEGACWVPARLVVSTNTTSWGEFGSHRPEELVSMVNDLGGDVDLDQFLTRFFEPNPIDLQQIPGWAGPIYRVGSNGTHRTHIARIFELPWLRATVNASAIPTEHSLITLVSNDIDNPLLWASDENFAQRTALLRGLNARGIIDVDVRVEDRDNPNQSTTLAWRHLPAPWLVRNPHHAARLNGIYESCYPGALERLGIPVDIGTNPAKWNHWLSSASS